MRVSYPRRTRAMHSSWLLPTQTGPTSIRDKGPSPCARPRAGKFQQYAVSSCQWKSAARATMARCAHQRCMSVERRVHITRKNETPLFYFHELFEKALVGSTQGLCLHTCLGTTARQTGLTGHFAASKSVWRAVWFFLWKERGHKTPRHCGESRHPVGRLIGTERCSGLRLSPE